MNARTNETMTLRIPSDLKITLKEMAAESNRSMNNFIVNCLRELTKKNKAREEESEWELNDETMAAIEESRSGKHAGIVDMTSFETFKASLFDDDEENS